MATVTRHGAIGSLWMVSASEFVMSDPKWTSQDSSWTEGGVDAEFFAVAVPLLSPYL
ncbi:hypothetical protein KEJ19_00860 [Candidatus Bathyarchaeota archaeon]|nr:hypothetical protein [Candidatus Bathyarchaeota archaeon]